MRSKKKPRVLAFLQNLWVRDPERVKSIIARGGEKVRNQIIARLLFAGGLTGRRLRQAFGEDLCRRIIWEECTREIAGDARTILKPSRAHILTALGDKIADRPVLVVAFGRIAAEAVRSCCFGKFIPFIASPHPAARQADVMDTLRKVAEQIREKIKEEEK